VKSEEQRFGLAWSRYLLDRLHRNGGDPLGEPDAGHGDCDDCSRAVLARWQVGRFLTCRACTASRRRAGEALQREEDDRERDRGTGTSTGGTF
jgi:hypothetical protein